MCKDMYVLTIDEDTQGLIINALLKLREEKLQEGMDVGWIGDVIVDVCNAPKRKGRFVGESHER
ncbi:MAG: hypothetical protein MJZ16_14565 [Bacteroidales bacterium]|nr:hypothetical protein [Bacteroidales bacterium]